MKFSLAFLENMHILLYYGTSESESWHVCQLVFYKLAQLNLIGNFQPRKDIITIYSLIRSIFFAHFFEDSQVLFFILLVINLTFFLFLLIYLNQHLKSQPSYEQIIQKGLHLMLNHFYQGFYIINLWTSFNAIKKINPGITILAVLNILVLIIILYLTVYFARFNETDKHFKLKSIVIVLEVMMSSLTVQSINQYASFSLFLVIWLSQTIILFSGINESFAVLQKIQVIQLAYASAIFLNRGLLEFLIAAAFIMVVLERLRLNQFQHVILNEQSLASCQISELNLKKMASSQEARIQLLIFKSNHHCFKCCSYQEIIECILKQNLQTPQQRIDYAVYIYKSQPLRALIELQKSESQTLFYKSLIKLFWQRFKVIRQQQYQDTTIVVQSTLLAEKFLVSLKQVVKQQILFWKQYLEQTLNQQGFLFQLGTIGKQITSLKCLIELSYNLNSYSMKELDKVDVQTLRILQLYYSVVHFDHRQIQEIRKKVGDLMKVDKYKSSTLDTLTIVQNRYVILSSSLIKKQNYLLNLNTRQLSNFMEIKEEQTSYITQIQNLLPNFLASIHDELIQKFIKKGNSQLMMGSQRSFYQSFDGYIVPCHIHLYPQLQNEDYIIHMILSRMQKENDYIVFGMNGQILGITESFFTSTTEHTFSSYFTDRKRAVTVNEIIIKGALIQFYLSNIIYNLQNLKDQLEHSNNNSLTNLSSIWEFPKNHLSLYQQLIPYLQTQSQNNHFGSNIILSSKTKVHTINTPSHTETNVQDSLDQSSIKVQGVEWKILDPYLIELIDKMLQNNQQEFNSSQNSKLQYLTVTYSLSFQKIELLEQVFGYFIISISELRSETAQARTKLYASSYERSESVRLTFDDIPEIERINQEDEDDEDLSEQIKIISHKNHLIYLTHYELQQQQIQQQYSITRSKFQSQCFDMDNTNRFSRIGTERRQKTLFQLQPLFSKPPMQAKSQLEDLDIINAESDIRQIESASQRQQKGHEIFEAEDENQEYSRFNKKQLTQTDSIKLDICNEKKSEKVQSQFLIENSLILERLTRQNFQVQPMFRLKWIMLFCLVAICTQSIATNTALSLIYDHKNNYFQGVENSGLIISNYAEKYTLLTYRFLMEELEYPIQLQARLKQAADDLFSLDNTMLQQKLFIVQNKLSNDSGLEESSFSWFQELDNILLRQYHSNDGLIDAHYFLRLLKKELMIREYKGFKLEFFTNQLMHYFIFYFLIVIFLLMMQGQILKMEFLYHKIILIICRINQNYVKSQIAKLQTIHEIIDHKENCNWKMSEFSHIILNRQKESNSNQYKLAFDGFRQTYFTKFTLILFLFLSIFYSLGLFLKYYMMDESIQVFAKQFYIFKQHIELSLLCGSLLKVYSAEQFPLDENQRNDLIMYYNTSTSLLGEYENQLIEMSVSPELSPIREAIVSNFCLTYPRLMSSCTLTTQYPNFNHIADQGVQSLIKLIQQQYATEFRKEVELNQLEDPQTAFHYMRSLVFQQLFVQFYPDIQKVFHSIQEDLMGLITSALDSYINLIVVYDLITGVILGLLYGLYGEYQRGSHNQQFKNLICSLREIPFEQIDSQNHIHQLKILEKYA